MINTIIIEGRLVKDNELKDFNGTKVINNTIAVYGGKDKDNNDKTYFIDFKAFNYTAEQLSKNTQKGSKIVLKGDLRVDIWQSEDGNNQKKVLIYADSVFSGEKIEKEQDKPEEIQESDDIPF